MYPVIILTGKAGSGKDTVAGMLAEAGGVCIAQADPLKRFGHSVFRFTDDQLWGPSECRNAIDGRNLPQEWEGYRRNFGEAAAEWMQEVGLSTRGDALIHWFNEEYVYAQQHGLTPRRILQTLGTEFGRKQRDTVWVDYAQQLARRLLDGNLGYLRQQGAVPKHVGRTEFVVITDGRFPNEILATKAAGGLAVKVTGPDATGLAGEAGKHASETLQDGIPDHWFDAVVWNDKALGFEPLRHQVGYLAKAVVCRPPMVLVPNEAVAL